ncbi:hypothetical protein FE783_16920 [Paenibacillus mesophilus]|uniref:hypothetical protein n=1 Tax=Paenibacillus mesophilus TaxID=2582849 RepID=UPI00110E5102|nr:hypothetical protein [Paenibacillus mesophilus]TMV48732.1 hypothetical protein FE783_16920 [Paenibacillus mesophilus]
MNITIGLVGPSDTVTLVQQVGREWETRLNLIPYVYDDVEDVADIIKGGKTGIDLWLFTGRIAFEIGLPHVPEANALMIRSSGSALMKTLFGAVRAGGIPKRFSIDTLTEAEVAETLNELQLHDSVPVVHPKSGYVPSTELIHFHESLFHSGEIDVCITHRGHVYEELLKLGISVYRIVPTVMSIRETLRLASQLGQTNHFRQSQIAALLLQVRNVFKEHTSSYEMHRLNLKLQELLLQFTEHIAGTLIPTGSTTFSLFSTRGAIERNTEFPPFLLFEKIRLLTGGSVHFGIGYGLTAFGAEQNAVLALSRTEKREDGGLVIADETGAVEEMYPNQQSLAFHYHSDDLEVINRLKRVGVSAATFNKIVSVQARTGKRSVSAADLASWLDMTPRNANRLLAELERGGLARVVGEEAPAPKGRPRKLFRIGVAEGEPSEAGK